MLKGPAHEVLTVINVPPPHFGEGSFITVHGNANGKNGIVLDSVGCRCHYHRTPCEHFHKAQYNPFWI